MYQFCKKLLSGVLAMALCISAASVNVFAADPVEEVAQISILDNDSISFSGDEENLFSAFQQLMPGDTRTQKLRLYNWKTDTVSFYLRVEAADQEEDLSQDELDRIYELLYDGLLKLKVTNGETVIFEDMLGGSGDSQNPPVTGTVTSPVYGLGSLYGNRYADLSMELTVDPSLGNEYADLIANVNWSIEALWEDYPIPSHPDTSDDTSDPDVSEPSEETIDESSVPLTSFPTESSVPEASWVPSPDGGNGGDGGEDEEIDEEDTPLTPFPEQEKAPQTGVEFPVVPVCVVSVCVGTAVVLMVLTRKKRTSAK